MPLKRFEPLRVMTLMPPPEKPLWRTIAWVLAWPPGVPWAASPKRSLLTAPSIWMLL